MPERWEQELAKLRGVEPREHVIRERAARGPSADRRPPRRNALVAGVVAGAVAIGGVAFLGQLDEAGREIGGGADDLPTLLVTFESNGFVLDEGDAQIRRVDTAIVYGDAHEENFTSITPLGALVDYVEVDRITHFVPGPTVGSPVQIKADGQDARVLIGTPADWPEFNRFTPIDRLPDEPGDYVVLFEAAYPDGIARTARFVQIVAPGGLQIVTDGGHALDTAMAAAYVDGRRSNGFLSTSWFTENDVGAQSEPRTPTFADDAWIELAPGSAIALATYATQAHAGLLASYSEGDYTSRLHLDLLQGAQRLDRSDGRYLLALDVTWIQVAPGTGDFTTEERAIFFFPIELVSEPREGVDLPDEGVSPAPSEVPSPSPSRPATTDGIVVSVFGVGERSDEMPTATFSYGGETRTACAQDFEWTLEDGTRLSGIADAGRPDSIPVCTGPAIPVPPGTSIAIETMSSTRVFTTRATTQFFEGDVGLVVSAEWPEGEATFIVPLTVAFTNPDLELVVLDCRPEDQLPITGPDTRIEPAGSAYIVGNLPGFERSDVVEQMTRDQRGESDLAGVWQVVREGSVVASVEYPDLSGAACEGTGIGGA
jgi:hypothetical protein